MNELVTIPGLHGGDEWTRFEGRAPRHLTALRQFRTRVPIQDSGAAFGMTRPNGPARQQSGPYEIPGHAHYFARSHSRIEVRSSYEKYSFALGAGIGARDGNTGRESGTCDRG